MMLCLVVLRAAGASAAGPSLLSEAVFKANLKTYLFERAFDL